MKHARLGGGGGPMRVPFRRTQLWLAVALAVACLIGFVTLLSGGNPKDWIRDHYTQVSHDASTGTYVLVSQQNVTTTTKRIRSAWKPAEEIVEPSGVFLRYHDLIVAVQPRAEGGSTVTLDDEQHGYNHWYSHVGGSWGVGSPSSNVRGGGPGTGK